MGSRACGCDEETSLLEQLEWVSWQRFWVNGSNEVNDLENQMEVLDGVILSDGFIEKSSKNARFTLGCKYRGFAEQVQSRLKFLSWSPIYEKDVFDNRTQKTYHRVVLRSRVSEILTKERYRWYPAGKKIVPKDLRLSDQCLLWWYIGDGHLCRKKSRPNYRRIVLAVNGFIKSDRMFLINLLKRRLGVDGVYAEAKHIIIARQALCKFIEIIGTKSPVSEYDYKFEFGNYTSPDYLGRSYKDRPLVAINEYRKKHKVRELNYSSRGEISHGQ